MRRDEADDRDPRPGALCAFWPESEPPLEEEIRLAFLTAFPEASLVDELERGEDLHWGLVFRLPDVDGDVVISAEPQDSLDPEFISEALDDPLERSAALAVKHLIVVEIPCDPPRAAAAYRLQARMLEAACVPGFPAVFDEPAAVVRSGRDVRALAAAESPPGPEALYAVHVSDGETGAWVHTHGLERLGLPELEIWGVDDADVAAAEALLHGVVGALQGGVVPDESGVISAGHDLSLRLMSLDDALRDLPAEIVASRREHEADEDGDHHGPRLVLADVALAEPPTAALDRVAESAAFYKPRSEARRRRRIAEERFGVFGQLFAMKRKAGWRFLAQLGFPTKGGEGTEHLWFAVDELKPGRLRGACLNAPAGVDHVRQGDEGWYGLEQLTDWLVVAPDGVYGPEAAPRVLEQEP